MKKNRHIAFITDDNYVFPTSIAIFSLISNLKIDSSFYYIIHVFSFGLSQKNELQLANLSKENCKVVIHCVDEKKYEHVFSEINQKTHVTPTALLKFELANLLPDVDEVLYLDGDIIVKGNIASIFNYDISNYALAASFEFWTYLSKLFNFDGDNSLPDFSFNSGVMLLNLNYFRKNNICSILWKTKLDSCNQTEKKENMMDQTTFNVVLAKSCLHLPIKYNCNNQFTEGIDISLINRAFNVTYSSSQDLKQDAIVIHYVGKREKPWLYKEIRCQEIWDYFCFQYGIDPNNLDRKKFNNGLHHYLKRLKRSLEVRGFKKTLMYLSSKRDIKL